MKKILALAVAGPAIAVAMPAFAQESPEATFTGPRVEAILGYDILKAGSSIDGTYDENNSIDGLLYGAGVGYDFDLGGIVIGAEGEITDSTAKSRFADNGEIEDFGYGRVKANRDLYVGARVGARIGPSTLIYAKGGYTNQKLKALAYDGTNSYGENFKLDGWRVGAGVEQAIGSHAFAKLEYRYSNYEKAKFEFGEDGPSTRRFDVDTDRHQVVAAVGMRF